MYEKFHGEVDRPYVLMHHIYCLKLGEPILHENKFAKKGPRRRKGEGGEAAALKAPESPAPATASSRRRGRPAAVPSHRGGGLRRRGEPECGRAVLAGVVVMLLVAACARAMRESGRRARAGGARPASRGGRARPGRRRALPASLLVSSPR